MQNSEVNLEQEPKFIKRLKIIRNVALATSYTLLISSIIGMATTLIRTAMISPKYDKETALIEELGDQSQEYKDTISYELTDKQNKFLNGEISSLEYEKQVEKLNNKEHKREVLLNVNDVDLTEFKDLQKQIKIEEIKTAYCLQASMGCFMSGSVCAIGASATHICYNNKKSKNAEEQENKELVK